MPPVPEEADATPPPQVGCAVGLIGCNALPMGGLAVMLASGPYWTTAQMLWYRGGSLGFLVAGAILPALALVFGARRFRWATTALGMWMVAVAFLWLGWVFTLGGGV